MCLLCVEIQKDKLTPKEIARNWREMPENDDHWLDVMGEIDKKGLIEDVSKAFDEINAEKKT